MSTNSSNVTIPEREVGWQAAPLTRGTASILWNCASVIILITWSSFHPDVGISWKQRIPTTIMATLVPQFTAMKAAKESDLAGKLYCAFKDWADRPEWRDGWGFRKSFLVVKGGIGVIQHNRYYSNASAESADTASARDETTHRHHSRDSDSEQSMDITSDEVNDAWTNGNSSDSISAQATNTAPCTIIIHMETFLLLAVTGKIRYEDFPTNEQIDDKSKADWFSRCAALAQLLWFLVNIVCRACARYSISALEVLVLDWIMFGFVATGFWWGCPQNVNTPYIVPTQDDPMSAEAAPLDLSADLAVGVLIGSVPDNRVFLSDTYISSLISTVIADGHKTNRFKGEFALPTHLGPMICQLTFSSLFAGLYQWHSAQPKAFWIIFTCLTTASEIVLIWADNEIEFNWTATSIYETYIRPFVPETSRRRGESRLDNEWLSLPRRMGIYPASSDSEAKRQNNRLRLLVAAAFVILLCHLGKLVIALTAFINAPEDIYKVPGYAILEVLGHVGG